MIIQFSTNRFQRFIGIIRYNYKAILIFLSIDFAVFYLYKYLDVNLHMPAVPISILGGALAIFLGFRNNSAYDRWWEARKIWGGIVNVSRSFSFELIALIHKNADSRKIIYRHLAWLNSVKLQLRKQSDTSEIEQYLSVEEYNQTKEWANPATQFLRIQAEEIGKMKKEGRISDIEQKQVIESLKTMMDLQGMAERIKGTVFPYYYVYFTQVFLWVFILLLPCILVEDMGWSAIPMAMGISFVFYILDKSGHITEDPFENRAADTPMSAICRIIEIDVKQMLGESNIPEKMPTEFTDYNVEFLK
ncbi:MAG: bestrophin family ion channel [Salibacteraceae bacterium]|nr:bestrophin family ion channel [Salibacteraceae bacterium]